MAITKRPLFEPPIVTRAMREALKKSVSPRHMVRNPVMFVVLVGGVLTTLVLGRDIVSGAGQLGFTLQIALWLWFTVVFANFAEAMAERRGKAQAESLRETCTHTMAKRLDDPTDKLSAEPVPATQLRKGDYVLCTPGDVIPGDGEVVEGVASVDESAITGESAPVIRKSCGDRSAVTGGTKVLSDYLIIRVTANPGETFLDRMIALIDSGQVAFRQERLRVGDVVQPLIPAAEARGERAAIHVTTDLFPALPRIVGDRRQLQEALALLLDEAVTRSRPGTTLLVTGDSADRGVTLTIAHTGDDPILPALPLFTRLIAAQGGTAAERDGLVIISLPAAASPR
jgi:hypothetical protein